MSFLNKELTAYIRQTLKPSTGLLLELEQFAKDNHVPIIKPEVMCLLRTLLAVKRPQKVLEIGTAIGYSALVFSEYIPEGGKIITVESNEDCAKLARQNFARGGAVQIKQIVGDGADVLRQTDETFDFIFLDANKSLYMKCLPDVLRILAPGGILAADNVLYRGMVPGGATARRKRTLVHNLQDFLSAISHDPRLTTSILPIGDGLSLSVRTEKKENLL